jgi:mono/diheme cytochrome c family protein
MTKLHAAMLLTTLAACALALTACSRRDEPAAPPSVATTDSRPAPVARGQYQAAIGDCYACHTVRGGAPYAGGLEMPTPFGVLFTPNITPDKQHGIGQWTADDFWRAMQEGRSKDGSFLYPAFPYTNYTKVTREDSDALYAYLMSLAPAAVPSKPHAMRFPYNQRELLAGWRTLYFKPGVYQNNPNKSAEWNRGAYLVEGLGHCNACHATRNILGAVTKDDDYSGGLIPLQNWYAPSLSSSREAGLGDWEMTEIVELLRTGISPRGAATGPMALVVQYSLQEMTQVDLRAMATYLKDFSEKKADEPWIAPHAASKAEVGAMMAAGAKIYKDRCEACHMEDGQGVARVYPPLAQNQAVRLRNPINAIRIVLNGGFPPSTEGNPRPYGMPPFYQELSDEQVAAVVTYIRQSWGNSASPVGSVQVQKSRGVPAD